MDVKHIHIAKNINYLRTQKGYSQDFVAKAIGVMRTAISNYENGVSDPGVEKLMKIADLLGVSIGDLITKDFSSESSFLDNEVGDTKSGIKVKGEMLGKEITNEAVYNTIITKANVNSGYNKTPFFNIVVSAGEHGITDWGMEEPTGYFVDIPSFRAADAAFPVLGFSMEPEISNGDIVGVREMQKWDFVDTAGVYMLITDQERMIKRLKSDEEDDNMFWCLSNNYAPFRLLRTDIRRMFKVVACISVL